MRILLTLLKTLFKGLHKEAAFHKQAEQLHTDHCTLYVASRNYEINTTCESHEPYITNDASRSNASFSFLSGDKWSDSIPAILSFELQEMMQGQPQSKKQKQQSRYNKIFFSDPHAKAREKIARSHVEGGGTLLIV